MDQLEMQQNKKVLETIMKLTGFNNVLGMLTNYYLYSLEKIAVTIYIVTPTTSIYKNPNL